MKLDATQMDPVTIVTIEGTLDALTAPQLSEYFNKQISSNRLHLVADFAGVDYTSSAGLRVLLGTVKEARRLGGDLRLAGVKANVNKVLTIAGFTSILKIFPDVDAAVASYIH